MNNIDYDKTKFDADSHGNLSKKITYIAYKGYKMDVGIGKTLLWDKSFKYIGDFPDEQSAKEHIDSITK